MMRSGVGLLLGSLLFTTVAYFALRPLWSALRTRNGTVAFWGAAVVIWTLGMSVRGAIPAALLIAWLIAAFTVAAIGVLVVHPVRGARAVWTWSKKRPAEVAAAAPQSPARRTFLKEVSLPTAAMSTGLVGASAGVREFDVREEEVLIRDLPAALDGFRIGQLTDVHVGEFIDVDYLRRAVAALDDAKVDLQVQTGDLIDDLTQLEPTLDALEATRARHGMIAILGNHEKWRSEKRVVDGYARRAAGGRLKLLVDDQFVVEHEGARLHVAGVDYPMGPNRRHRLPRPERQAKMKAMADKAFARIPPGAMTLCLAHHPDFFPFAAEKGAQLTLSGHTHGGQVGLFRIPLFFFAFEHMIGMYRRGGSKLYVSAGTGHWLPFRIGMPAEVTVLTLRRGAAVA